jgi:hypothetical protein
MLTQELRQSSINQSSNPASKLGGLVEQVKAKAEATFHSSSSGSRDTYSIGAYYGTSATAAVTVPKPTPEAAAVTASEPAPEAAAAQVIQPAASLAVTVAIAAADEAAANTAAAETLDCTSLFAAQDQAQRQHGLLRSLLSLPQRGLQSLRRQLLRLRP